MSAKINREVVTHHVSMGTLAPRESQGLPGLLLAHAANLMTFIWRLHRDSNTVRDISRTSGHDATTMRHMRHCRTTPDDTTHRVKTSPPSWANNMILFNLIVAENYIPFYGELIVMFHGAFQIESAVTIYILPPPNCWSCLLFNCGKMK